MGKLAEDRAAAGKAAYTLVDLGDIDKEDRELILEDARAGGKTYGVRIVEEAVNGPARQGILGVYEDDKEKWEATKKRLGVSVTEVDDGDVGTTTNADPRELANLRQRAQEMANEEADKIRTAEEDEIREIVEGPAEDDEKAKPDTKKNKAPR